jgi:hypothetical protein
MTRLPESTARRYGKVFDEIATEYDRHRPAYPFGAVIVCSRSGAEAAS